jgi:hypothetical protein
LVVAGEIAVNAPVDCLLETSDVELIYYYVSPNDPLASPIPEHDALFVAICDLDETRDILAALELALANWPKPIINLPQNIRLTSREPASKLLHGAPGLISPATLRASRDSLLGEQSESIGFPVIIRPLDSHAGRNLAKIESIAELSAYLAKVGEKEFFLSPFIDYSGSDGLFRKMRLAVIDGRPYACHMGVSSHWMIHYLNAGMYDDPKKRQNEAAFMDGFNDFAKRHSAALEAIFQRTGLEYLCIDCAETKDGQLLIFEIDPTMVVHSMDPVDLFPYKQIHMQKVKNAFLNLLSRLTNR